MFTIGTAAYKLYSASSQVGSTLSTLSNYHKYVTEAIFNSPSEVSNLHPLVKQNLDRLARRIQVLSSPLNYCLLWSQHRGSAVAETIHQSKEVLKQTYHWLHECNKDKSKLSDKEYMLKKLDEHIREIEFCLQSLNLALSIIQTTETTIPTASSSSNYYNNYISPSSLLSASNRIQAMHNAGGDVAICFGQLFKKSIINNTGCWQRIYRRCALKIYRNGIRRSYELRIECNEYRYDSDDNMDNDIMNESHPLTLKFDLTSSIYFTTLSSLIIDLPHHKNQSFTKSNININNLNKNDLIQDAFGWIKMIANQVQEQYIFVLKSGLDDWDIPLSSTSDDDQIQQQQQQQQQTIIHQNIKKKQYKKSPKKSAKQTSLIFLKDGDNPSTMDQVEEEHEIVYTKTNDNDINNNDIKEEHGVQHLSDDDNDYHLTASIASLDTAVQQTRRRTHLGHLLAPGGDYDESHVTPQLMAYMTRLAIYENDYTKPHNVYHTNSTFKKYNTSNMNNTENMNISSNNNNNNNNTHDVKIDETDNNSVIISTSMTKQQSNASSTSTSSSSCSTDIDNNNNNDNNHNMNDDVISNDDNSSEFSHRYHHNDDTKIFPSSHTIKQQQKIPAHLNASDEELYLFLRNPPSPPIPFYPANIHFNDNKHNKCNPSPHKSSHKSSHKSPHRKHTSTARQYRRLNTRKLHKMSDHKSMAKNRMYFAAPNNINDVTIIYPKKKEEKKNDDDNNDNNNDKKEDVDDDRNNDNNLSLSISDENHMKYVKKNENKQIIITSQTKQSMAAIKDATNSSLLENVDLTTSQTFSAANTPRNETNNNNDNNYNDNDDNILRGNFANLSIDDDD